MNTPPSPEIIFGGLKLFLSLSHICALGSQPGWQQQQGLTLAEAALGGCWHSQRLERLANSAGTWPQDFLPFFFLCPSLKATAKGEWEGWVFVSFKPQGFHPLRASASKAPAVPVSRILLILCLRFIHIYIEIYLINILYENKYFICVLRTIVMLIYSPAIMLCLVFVLDNAVPIALFLTYRHHLPASSWGSRKPPRGRDGPFASSSFNVLTAWVWLVLVKFMRKMLPFTAPVSC